VLFALNDDIELYLSSKSSYAEFVTKAFLGFPFLLTQCDSYETFPSGLVYCDEIKFPSPG
jgi:hypothetical protein